MDVIYYQGWTQGLSTTKDALEYHRPPLMTVCIKTVTLQFVQLVRLYGITGESFSSDCDIV